MVQVMAQAQGGLGADRTPFYGGRVPDDIKKMVKCVDVVGKATFRKLLQGKRQEAFDVSITVSKVSRTFHRFVNGSGSGFVREGSG